MEQLISLAWKRAAFCNPAQPGPAVLLDTNATRSTGFTLEVGGGLDGLPRVGASSVTTLAWGGVGGVGPRT